MEVPFSKIKKVFNDKKYDIFPSYDKITTIGKYAVDVIYGGKAFYSNEGLMTLFSKLVGDKKAQNAKLSDIKKINGAVTSVD